MSSVPAALFLRVQLAFSCHSAALCSSPSQKKCTIKMHTCVCAQASIGDTTYVWSNTIGNTNAFAAGELITMQNSTAVAAATKNMLQAQWTHWHNQCCLCLLRSRRVVGSTISANLPAASKSCANARASNLHRT